MLRLGFLFLFLSTSAFSEGLTICAKRLSQEIAVFSYLRANFSRGEFETGDVLSPGAISDPEMRRSVMRHLGDLRATVRLNFAAGEVAGQIIWLEGERFGIRLGVGSERQGMISDIEQLTVEDLVGGKSDKPVGSALILAEPKKNASLLRRDWRRMPLRIHFRGSNGGYRLNGHILEVGPETITLVSDRRLIHRALDSIAALTVLPPTHFLIEDRESSRRP